MSFGCNKEATLSSDTVVYFMGSLQSQVEANAQAQGFLSGALEEEAMKTCNLNPKHANVKPTQVSGLYQSPTRAKSYDIEARSLFYNLPMNRNTWFRNNDGEAENRCILRNVSCKAKPREIMAIAGPSGAGKSTLLELLAGRIKPSSPPNSILVNNQPMNISVFRRISGYVTQEDALFPLLTVQETLMFSARLRLPSRTVPEAEKLARVKALINELGLQNVADSRIGNEKIRGISGGERRRVSIGVDAIHDPAVLLLDEPTSGLDSFAALQIISMLKSMAELHGRTIILSIHQPGYRILELFSSILLLANGSSVHHGSLEMLECALVAAGHQIVAHINVLEYAIDVLSSPEQINGLVSIGVGDDKSGQCGKKVKVTLFDLFLSSGGLEREHDPMNEVTFANSRAQEIMTLAHRFSKNVFRTKQLFAIRTLHALCAGLGLGSIFYNVGYDATGLEERIGFFAFSLTFLLSSTTEGLPIFLHERNILMRETSGGAYRVSSYVIANAIVFLPFLLIVALVYSTPVYWLVGLNNKPSAFLYFVLVVWVVIYTANSFVAFFSSLAPNFIIGNTLITGFMGTFFLFSGYFISKSSIPKYWMFMHYLSLFKYPFEAFLINEYSSLKDRCVEYMFDRCILDVRAVLAEQGLNESNRWVNLMILLGFICTYRFLSFVVLRFRCYKPRRGIFS